MQSHSIKQGQLKNVCDQLCDNIEDLLNHFDLDYRMNPNFCSMSCPIHGGDNESALNIYHEGDFYRGNWVCRTHGCEQVFLGSILGFIRGIMSHNKLDWQEEGDDVVSFSEVMTFVKSFLNIDLVDEEEIYDVEKRKFLSSLSVFHQDVQVPTNTEDNIIDRNLVRSSLSIPSQYFLNRGFSAEILEKYDVGDCQHRFKPMFNRAVVPIYDNDHSEMIGCSGRTICEQLPKWKHSKGLKTDSSLYNFWYAKEHIKKSMSAILVESPGNVWKLEMSDIHNSLAIYGSSLSVKQKILLDMTGAMTLYILTDNDEAGKKCRENIEKQCCKIYNIEHIYAKDNDVGEMSTEEIKELFRGKI